MKIASAELMSASTMNSKPRGRTRSVRTSVDVERVRAVIENSERSVRKRAVALRMSSRTVFRILHQDLHIHPYKLMIVQQLNEPDFALRLQFAVIMHVQKWMGVFEMRIAQLFFNLQKFLLRKMKA